MSAFAERGAVRARVATSSTLNPPANNWIYGGCAYAEFTIDDFVVSGPPGLGTASLNLDVFGVETGDANVAIASPPAVVSITLISRFPGGSARDVTSLTISGPAGSVTTGAVDFEAGDRLEVIVSISVRAVLGLSAPGSKSADVDYASLAGVYGARFAQAGPVLNLPPGYTVDSVDGNIVNNQYLGNQPPPSVPALGPLGSAALALCLGAAGLAAARLRPNA
jgi:hypothetical protein